MCDRCRPWSTNVQRESLFMTTSQEPNLEVTTDKVGDELNTQRFHMLEDIARELKSVVVFPTYFDVAMRLRKALQDPDISITRIASLVSLEPLVAAKLMHLANSALYISDGKPVRSLPEAITRLGVELVRTTAVAIAMNQILRAKDMAVFSDLTHALWQHSIRTAATARVLARTYTRVNPEEALLAGLVHDLGAFYMLYRAAQYPELRQRPESVKHLIMQWHEGIGVTLLGVLGLPDEIIQATVDHDHPRAIPEAVHTLSDVVYISNILAGAHFEWLYQDVDPIAAENTIARANFAGLLAEIDADTQEMQSVFT